MYILVILAGRYPGKMENQMNWWRLLSVWTWLNHPFRKVDFARDVLGATGCKWLKTDQSAAAILTKVGRLLGGESTLDRSVEYTWMKHLPGTAGCLFNNQYN